MIAHREQRRRERSIVVVAVVTVVVRALRWRDEEGKEKDDKPTLGKPLAMLLWSLSHACFSLTFTVKRPPVPKKLLQITYVGQRARCLLLGRFILVN